MRTVVDDQKMSDMIDERYDKTKLITAEGQVAYDQYKFRTKRYIFTRLSRDLLHQVREHKTAPDMWKALVAIYEDKSDPTIQGHCLRQVVHDLWNAKLGESGNVNAHLARMFNLRTDMADLQYTVNELDMREALLSSSPTTTQYK